MFRVLLTLVIAIGLGASEFVLPCYISHKGRFDFEKYEPGLCTHIFYGSATVKKTASGYKAAPADPETDLSTPLKLGNYARLQKLKSKQPGLKIVLSIGDRDWDETAKQKFYHIITGFNGGPNFTESALKLVKDYKFDGIDIVFDKDVENLHISWLFQELRSAAPDILITTSLPWTDDPYGVRPNWDEYVDYINVQTFDFHGPWENTTGFNSALYGYNREDNNSVGVPPKDSVAYRMNWWVKRGIPPHKLLLGIPAFGHGWTHVNITNETQLMHPVPLAGRPSKPFNISNKPGFFMYSEICRIAWMPFWSTEDFGVFFLKVNPWRFWFYDNVDTVNDKMNYVKENGFGGAFLWYLDYDDVDNRCSDNETFPLVKAMGRGLGLTPTTTAPTTTTPSTSAPTTTTPASPLPTTSEPTYSFKCPFALGSYADPHDCRGYYTCQFWISIHHWCPPWQYYEQYPPRCVIYWESTCRHLKSDDARQIEEKLEQVVRA